MSRLTSQFGAALALQFVGLGLAVTAEGAELPVFTAEPFAVQPSGDGGWVIEDRLSDAGPLRIGAGSGRPIAAGRRLVWVEDGMAWLLAAGEKPRPLQVGCESAVWGSPNRVLLTLTCGAVVWRSAETGRLVGQRLWNPHGPQPTHAQELPDLGWVVVYRADGSAVLHEVASGKRLARWQFLVDHGGFTDLAGRQLELSE